MSQANSTNDDSDPFKIEPKPELVVGVVGPLGINLDELIDSLKNELQRVNYKSIVIRLSRLLHEVQGLENQPTSGPEHKRIESHMKAGTELRTSTETGGILARLAIAAIQIERERITGSANRPASGRAYILRSLKHRLELQELRDVYGDGFIAISAYAPRKIRERSLTNLLAKSSPNAQRSDLRKTAAELIETDEAEEGKELGQNVEGAFPLADCFVEASNRQHLRENLRRFIEIFFGNQFLTPTRDEFGMHQASAAARRSADLSRQVGAALATVDAGIVAVGCNDTPRAGGGLYWTDDDPDGRDFELFGHDPSEQAKREIIAETLERLASAGLLKDQSVPADFAEIADKLISNQLKGAQITNLLEFGRVLHAEMAAITDAARRGVSTTGTTLYCTTFPCHLCARLIISSGVSRVVFIEPYPKSKAYELYYDSIIIDELKLDPHKVNFQSFVGVAPRRFDNLFRLEGSRKQIGGEAIQWDPTDASPKIRRIQASYISIETKIVTGIPNSLHSAGLSWNN